MPRTPLKQGRNGTRSINKAIAAITQPPDLTALTGRVTDLEGRVADNVEDATDAASAITQVNAVIAALVAAGLMEAATP